MKIQLNAAQRLATATKLSAGYEGTKVRDLNAYVRSLGIGVAPGTPGPGGPSSGIMIALVTSAKAHALASALVKDGWKGRLTKKKIKREGEHGEFKVEEVESMVYTCPAFDDRNVAYPSIKMSKPDSRNMVRVMLTQITDAAARENFRRGADLRNQRRRLNERDRLRPRSGR